MKQNFSREETALNFGGKTKHKNEIDRSIVPTL